VLVGFEPSQRGRAALLHALGVARQAAVPLTVVAVATQERVDVGCVRCRHSAALWNRELRALADEELAEAAKLVGPVSWVRYKVTVGRGARAISEAADSSGADVIVLPSERPRRFRRSSYNGVVEELRRAGRWTVIVAPESAAADANSQD